jgi:hypothetical protein
VAYRTYQKQQRREERPTRSLTPAQAVTVPGKYVVEFGRGPTPKIEFFSDGAAATRRLGRLYDEHRREAQARLATWHDVVLYWQEKL